MSDDANNIPPQKPELPEAPAASEFQKVELPEAPKKAELPENPSAPSAGIPKASFDLPKASFELPKASAPNLAPRVNIPAPSPVVSPRSVPSASEKPNVLSLAIDVIAAAVAIAFSVMIVIDK